MEWILLRMPWAGLGKKEVARLSQRDRETATWVIFGQKWKRIFCRQTTTVT